MEKFEQQHVLKQCCFSWKLFMYKQGKWMPNGCKHEAKRTGSKPEVKNKSNIWRRTHAELKAKKKLNQKPYNKSLINLVHSVCTGKYLPSVFSHFFSFVARSVRKPDQIFSRTDLGTSHSVNKPLKLKITLSGSKSWKTTWSFSKHTASNLKKQNNKQQRSDPWSLYLRIVLKIN